MGYPAPSNKRDAADTKVAVKFSQEIFSVKVKHISPNTFAGRLMIAAKTSKKGEVTRKLGVEASMMALYQKVEEGSGSYPAPERLIKFSVETKCDLHWLLTGEGEASRDSMTFLGENERRIIDAIASDENKKPEQIVRDLVVEAMATRAAELFTHLNRTGRITESERQQLVVLYDLVQVKSKVA